MRCLLLAAFSWMMLSSVMADQKSAIKPKRSVMEKIMKAKVFKAGFGREIKYRIYIPADYGKMKNKKYPLVLFFHGAGERGSDNKGQLRHGLKDMIAYLNKHKIDAIIAAPQCPNGKQWVNTPWSANSHTMDEYPSEPMIASIKLLEFLLDKYEIDRDRIYVTGLSMGGFATWDIIQRKPKLFAAALAVCGGGDVKQAKKLVDLPIWAVHGDQDTVVKTQRSRDMIAAIKKAGGSPKYTEIKGCGHGAWGPAYRDEKILKWFFSQKRNSKK